MLRRTILAAFVPGALLAQVNFDTVTVKAQHLRGSVYVITGAGGNIGLSVGDDAAFLVDDQFAPLVPKIIAAIRGITNKDVRYVVNTHWHGDHTGGNEPLGKAGSVIVAQANVRKRMSTEQFLARFNQRFPPSPRAALPVVTFADSVTMHVNGDDMTAVHVPAAHTDGDALVFFAAANVIHMGDTFMTIGYPFIDLASGGTANGFVRAADRALASCNAQTIVIPGHGPTTDCAGLRAWRTMLATIQDRVRAEMQRGRTLAQIQAAGLTKEFDDRWGKSFIPAADFLESVYQSLGGR
jgi:cyclase